MIDWNALVQAMGDLDEEKTLTIVRNLFKGTLSSEEADQLLNACQEAMTIVGDRYENGDYFVGDLLFAGDLLTDVIEMLKASFKNLPDNTCTILVGTVEGDLHDIGKHIFKNIAEAVGFQVVDIGIDQPASEFVKKVKAIQPKIVGMSGILTLALDSMKKTVQALEEAGLRDNVKIIIGGAPVTAEACKIIGADAFAANAADGVKICQQWLKEQT
ncbi:cobalamin-dependent protein [Dehalobacter sp. DCM]|uniref:cobalamin B12-binding domain-containing protein n=1 Tax=Dehalobacter sp. DCM TaxID=2907827 RepID=UPI0030817C7E|nr:cobalamin-dependent protein [Dehalobacter sp. DCM]